MKTSLISLQIGLGLSCYALASGAVPTAVMVPYDVTATMVATSDQLVISNDAVVEKKTALDLSRLSITAFGDVDAPSH